LEVLIKKGNRRDGGLRGGKNHKKGKLRLQSEGAEGKGVWGWWIQKKWRRNG